MLMILTMSQCSSMLSCPHEVIMQIYPFSLIRLYLNSSSSMIAANAHKNQIESKRDKQNLLPASCTVSVGITVEVKPAATLPVE